MQNAASGIAATFQRATLLHQQGQIPQAQALYAEVLRLQPQHPGALHFLGIAALQTGRVEQGIELIRESIRIDPKQYGAHLNLGRTLLEQQQPAAALASFDQALQLNPRLADALNNRGNALLSLNRPADALASYDAMLRLQPHSAEAHNNRGNALMELGRREDALASYDQALRIAPRSFDVLNNRGTALLELKRAADALASFDLALQLAPDFHDAHYNRANALRDLGRLEEALAGYDRALQLAPASIHALINRGIVLRDLKRPQEALVSFDEAISNDPHRINALNNRGNALLDLGQAAQALVCYESALQLAPDSVDALNNRGNALLVLERPEAALESHDAALRLNPGLVETLNNRGHALLSLKRADEALASYQQALQLRPDLADTHYNCGNALRDLRRSTEAVACYDHALQLRPDFADALESRGAALSRLRREEEATESFDRLLRLDPDREYALGNLLRSRMHCCDWRDHAEHIRKLAEAVRTGKRAALPGTLLAVFDDPLLHLSCARAYAEHEYPAAATSLWNGERYPHDRIRIAYLSADFYDHATSRLMIELLERHDRTRFEITAISFGPDVKDAMRERLEPCFDRYVDVRGMRDQVVARLIREIEIDIAVDLKGYTSDARPRILAHRPAPIQVNYLGYPATLGAPYIDYILADPIVIPQQHDDRYTEKVIRLPNCYQPNDSRRTIAAHVPTRAEVGLPEEGFVFCCFNNNYKITPAVFDIWMRLLRQVSGSVLWLFEGNAAAGRNLRIEVASRGIAPERLVFAPRVEVGEHLARHRLADLFLDTSPYNAHTTASDALWAGLPILTRSGETFASRVAASLLHAVGLPELVTETAADYEALALRLATSPELLSGIRQRLARSLGSCALFDADRFRRNIEEAYVAMWQRHRKT